MPRLSKLKQGIYTNYHAVNIVYLYLTVFGIVLLLLRLAGGANF